eukprot:GHVT01019366.1.p3 GENE.GHVT01019366.1~~GHVT01019366.1.p3  ORF type:complete len:122 (-),score=4.27 GHVT01019366.1:544-909(-)
MTISLTDCSNQEVVAFLHYRFEVDTEADHPMPVCYVYELQVKAGYQSLGIGHHLLRAITEISRSLSLEKVMCTIQKENKRAVKFYKEKCGFVIDESNPNCDDFQVEYEILKKPCFEFIPDT